MRCTMKKLQFTGLLFLFISSSFSQITCDTSSIIKIINYELKIFDRSFSRPYILSETSVPYDTTKSYFKSDSIFNTYFCGHKLNWNDFNLKSKYGKVENDSIKDNEYSLFISTPIFNNKMTKCRFITNTHYNEWGGSAFIKYYEKKRNRWKLVKQTLICTYS